MKRNERVMERGLDNMKTFPVTAGWIMQSRPAHRKSPLIPCWTMVPTRSTRSGSLRGSLRGNCPGNARNGLRCAA